MVEDTMPQAGYTPEEFNPKATAMGCSVCGYPVRPTDTECPSCGHSFSVLRVEPEIEPVNEKKENKAAVGGNIIQGASAEKDTGNRERKRLVGFLVSYSLSPNGDFFPLYEGKNLVGRDDAAQVNIQGDSNISERHLSILYRTVDRKFKFKDEQSSNGSFINEELIDEGELKNFDVIRIGVTRLLFMEIPQDKIF
jgi:pSer/pThr/pTyr-binding forkhead associated (FHA) protein